MSDTDETKRPAKTLSLKKTETSTVKQSFSHGRTKAVVVEKKRSATPPAAAAKPVKPAEKPAEKAAPPRRPRRGQTPQSLQKGQRKRLPQGRRRQGSPPPKGPRRCAAWCCASFRTRKKRAAPPPWPMRVCPTAKPAVSPNRKPS